MSTAISVKMDESVKTRASSMLEAMGMTLGGFVNMAVRQLLIQGRLPFAVVAPTEAPTEETRRALVEAEAKALGLIPDDSIAFEDGSQAAAFIRSL